MSSNFNSLNLISEGDANYVDLSAAVEVYATASTGCLTLIGTENSFRIKIGKQLLADIGNPEAVKILTLKNNVVILSSPVNAPKSFKLGKDGVIYNTELAKTVIEVSGAEVKEKGSTRLGSYHLQALDGDAVAAVVSFK